DGVLHFLTQHHHQELLTTEGLSHDVAKIVSALGHPGVAREISRLADAGKWKPKRPGNEPRAGDWRQVPELRAEEGLQFVCPRDLQAAHRDGLLTLTGLSRPFELWASSLGMRSRQLTAAIFEARAHTGGIVAIDGPEQALAGQDGSPEALAARFAEELSVASSSTGLSAVVNLNDPNPTQLSDLSGDATLFADSGPDPATTRRVDIARALLEALAN